MIFSSPKKHQIIVDNFYPFNGIMKKIIRFIVFLVCVFSLKTNAQDSSRLRVSLLTCTPGNELYSIFGHSAIRIVDSNNVNDLVFNYGTFNFNDDDFYIKFIKGKLNYFVSVQQTEDFIYNYFSEGRGITEQVLNFSEQEKINIQHALIENLKEENKYYQYDFFYDNCTTRLRDIISKSKQPNPLLPYVMPEKTRFRQAIHMYLDKSEQHWSKLGIDLLLGAKTDKIMSAEEQEFLPENLMYAFDQCTNQKLVSEKNQLTPPTFINQMSKLTFTPNVCFWIFFTVIFILSFLKNKFVSIITTGLDFTILFFTGALGILFIFMWFGTDHIMTKNNYNILWALPTNLIAAFFIRSKQHFIHNYFLFVICFLSLILICWNFLPQQLNISLIPIILSLIVRMYCIISKKGI
jgi:hypothetical protein